MQALRKGPGLKENFLNNLLGSQTKNQPMGMYFMNGQQVQSKPNSRASNPKPMGTDSFDNRHNLDKAISAYGPTKKVTDPIHNRSKSVNENKKLSNVYNTQD